MKRGALSILFMSIVSTVWAIQEDGLVLYLPFEEGAGDTTADQSGNGLVGALNGVAWSDEGQLGGCVQFNDAGAFIEIDPTPILDLTEELTLTVWINPIEAQGDSSVMGRRNAGNQGGYALQWSAQFTGSQQIEMWLHKGGWNGTRNLQAVSPDLEAWHFIATTFDGSTLRQYIDNELDAELAVAAPLDSVDVAFRIGQAQTGLTSMFGRMDEIAIYDRALSEADLAENMTSGGLAVFPEGRAVTSWARLKVR